MDNRRQNKIGSLMQEVLTEILYKQGKNIYGNAMVSVTGVKVTSDLSLARFYFSIYNTDMPTMVMEKLEEMKSSLKKEVSAKMRNLRKIPEFEFYKDDTLEYTEKINQLFEKIKADDQKIKNQSDQQD
jgi:ribosome-binding factor A